MSRLGPLAFLLILCSAAAASACCFFKCCYKNAPIAPEGQSILPSPHQTTSATLRITSVDGEAPDSTNNITHDVDSTHDLEVIVESNFDPSGSNPELTLTDLGPRIAAAKSVAAKTKKYRPVRIREKPHVVAPAPTSPAPGPPPARIWQCFYTIPHSDLAAGHNYSLFATAGSVTSSTVTFHTR